MFITTGICEGSMSTHHVMFTTIFADDDVCWRLKRDVDVDDVYDDESLMMMMFILLYSLETLMMTLLMMFD